MEEAKNSDKAMCAARVGVGSGSGSGSGRVPCGAPQLASQSVTATAQAQHGGLTVSHLSHRKVQHANPSHYHTTGTA